MHMNEKGLSEKEIFSYLENVKSEDTDYYKVLSSMCTRPHKIAVRGMIILSIATVQIPLFLNVAQAATLSTITTQTGRQQLMVKVMLFN